jgi:hypothetical protein
MSTLTFPTNGVHHEADEAIDQLYSWMPGPQPAPQACPEATFSLTLKGTLDGHETLLTVRGQTAEEFRRNLQQVRGLLDPVEPKPLTGNFPVTQPQPQASSQPQAQLSPQQHNAAAMHKKVSGFCPVHNVQMQENHKDGRTWYSHKVDGRWCKGR